MNFQKETHINISDIKHHQLLRLWLIALAPKSPISLLPSTLAVAFHLLCWTLIILHLYLWIHYYWTIFSFLPGHVVRKKMREPTCLPLSGSTYNTFAKSPVPLARLSKLQSSNTSYNCGAIMCWTKLEQGVRITYHIDEKASPGTAVFKLGFEGNQVSGALSWTHILKVPRRASIPSGYGWNTGYIRDLKLPTVRYVWMGKSSSWLRLHLRG